MSDATAFSVSTIKLKLQPKAKIVIYYQITQSAGKNVSNTVT
jgi:hypothetical protein